MKRSREGPGAETVARYLRAIQVNECEGYCSVVNVTALHYILNRESDPERADEYVARDQWCNLSRRGRVLETGRPLRLHV